MKDTVTPEELEKLENAHAEFVRGGMIAKKTYEKYITPAFPRLINTVKRVYEMEEENKRLIKFARAHEKWEANLILDSNAWNTPSGFPIILEEHYEAWIDGVESLQKLRNEALKTQGEAE